jgi:hypothetical protein
VSALPPLNASGDLPPGVYRVPLPEVVARFGGPSAQRVLCTQRLLHVYDLAQRAGHVERFIIFGTSVTAKPDPADVDILLVMRDDFRSEACPLESLGLFDHAVAQARYGASLFWIRPSLLFGETVDTFIAHWQRKRDGSRRGIVEVTA